MKKTIFLSAVIMMSSSAMMAQSAIDIDFESNDLSAWTQYIPEGHTGGFSIVTYASQSALKVANVGENNLAGTYCLLSKTGAKNAVKANSDNWLVSPAVAVTAEQNVLSFRFAANCSYSPSKEAGEKMQMQVLVGESSDTTAMTTVLATITPENYAKWRQYSLDLSAYEGKTIHIAFHDFGVAGSGAIADLKYIDNIQLSGTKASDFAIEASSALYGQADYSPEYTITVANYGIAKGQFVANYQIGEQAVVSETVTTALAAGEVMEYTFAQSPIFNPGETTTVKTWISAADDAFLANDSTAVKTVTSATIATLPYTLDETQVETALASLSSKSSKAKWAYDPIQYEAWIFSQLSNDDKYIGIAYLYTNEAVSLPQGPVKLTTTGTATLTDMTYEVYVAKYAAEGMAGYATLVGTSDTLQNVVETETIETAEVMLDIPEAGEYILAIRPITHLKNAQMTLIGLSLQADQTTSVEAISVQPTRSSAVYDLNGRRVAQPAHGLYVIDGKKVRL